jgi:maleate cis-trans isomerase
MTPAAQSADLSLEGSTGFARARIGLIIPYSNSLTEPQFRHFLPPDVAVHVTRLQMTGKHHKTLPQLLDEVARAASALGDARCDVIVFHCTANSMEHGPAGEQLILETVRAHSGAIALSTAQAVVEAFRAQQMTRMVLVSPYQQAANDHEKHYLEELGFKILHDVALGVTPNEFLTVPPARWVEIVRANLRDEADGYFLSCTNTTQIDTIPLLEAELGKPVVNSNQATIWACAKRLGETLGPLALPPRLGSLIRHSPASCRTAKPA